MEKIKRNKSKITIAILLVLVGILYFKNVDLKWQLIYEKSVPDVELINYLSFNSKNIAAGSATGFVVFDDKEKQPRDFRQYVMITASKNLDVDGKQVFYLTDIIKMSVLAPRYVDPVALTVKNMSGDIITLADTDNNLYQINTVTHEVSMFDSTRDVAKLMTSDSDFRDFMVDFLK